MSQSIMFPISKCPFDIKNIKCSQELVNLQMKSYICASNKKISQTKLIAKGLIFLKIAQRHPKSLHQINKKCLSKNRLIKYFVFCFLLSLITNIPQKRNEKFPQENLIKHWYFSIFFYLFIHVFSLKVIYFILYIFFNRQKQQKLLYKIGNFYNKRNCF